MKKYQVTTNIKALAKINDFLNGINIENVPVLDFSKDKTLANNFVSLLLMNLSTSPVKFNNFFQTITNTTDDFLEMEAENYQRIAVDFFTKLPLIIKSTIQMSIQGLQKQKEMVMNQNKKVMQDSMEKILNEKIDSLEIFTENG